MATLFTRIVDNAGNGIPGHSLRLRRRWGVSGRVGATTSIEDVVATTDATGFVTQSMLGGEYRIWIGASEARRIVIPDDDGTYLLEDLLGVTGGAAALTYRYQDTELQILNGTTGAWHGFRVTGEEGEEVISIDEVVGATNNYKWKDGTLLIRNADTEAWHAIHLTGATPQFALAADGELLSANARMNAGKLQLLNITTNLYHSIYLTGSASSWVIAAGEA
jgi:hypothetical protein